MEQLIIEERHHSFFRTPSRTLCESNIALAKQAHYTYEQSGLTPSELLEQNKKLKGALEEANNTLQECGFSPNCGLVVKIQEALKP